MNNNEPILRKTFNINFIRENILKIKNEINEIIKSGNNNILEHELEIMNKYSDFYDSYPFLVKKLCKGDDLDMLDNMFKNLEKVESGDSSLASVELNLGNKLAKQYLHPNINK